MESNKIALVTGGSRGLGRNMAISLAQKGLDVVLTYHKNKAAAEDVVAEIEKNGQRAVALQLDVSNYEEYEGFFDSSLVPALKDTFGTEAFDYLVNNAGTGLYAPLENTNLDQFKDMVHIHLMAPFFITQFALKHLNQGGGIVNISSGLTRFAFPGYGAYASMKGGVETLSKYQAKELGSRQINVNVVAPGAIETDFGGGVVRDNQELNDHIASATALGRVGLPSDIGSVVAFLCTDEAKWINAQRIEVSGGMNL